MLRICCVDACMKVYCCMLPFCYPYYHGRALGFTLDEIDVRIFRLAVEKAFSWLYSLAAGFADRCGAPLKMDVIVGWRPRSASDAKLRILIICLINLTLFDKHGKFVTQMVHCPRCRACCAEGFHRLAKLGYDSAAWPRRLYDRDLRPLNHTCQHKQNAFEK